ncbi:DUF6230 family protein [Pseudonocardia alni]|uniref:DUF6230 family protein n=1 Tax=Pseudonocardia alni TaxID=33907 RepID=UPI00332FA42C
MTHRVGTHCAPPSPAGHVRGRRFAMVFLPSMPALGLLAAGVAGGAVPVALAMEGRQTLKFTAARFDAEARGALPSFVQNQDGSRQPVVVLQLSGITIAGACVSTAVDTPLGSYVLPAVTEDSMPIVVGDAQIAIESLDGVGAAGQQVLLNRSETAPDGTPVDTSTGGVPVTAGGLALDIRATARWATVNQLTLSRLRLQVGQDQPKCL